MFTKHKVQTINNWVDRVSPIIFRGRLHGLAVACWTTDHYHACSNPGVGISEGCFVFRFVSLSLEIARSIWPTMCTNVAVKHQSSSSSPIIFRTEDYLVPNSVGYQSCKLRNSRHETIPECFSEQIETSVVLPYCIWK